MDHLETVIHLPSNALSTESVKALLRLALEEYQWFQAARYGSASMSTQLDPGHLDYDALLSFFEKKKMLCVGGRTDQHFLWLFPSKPGNPPHFGKILWATSLKDAAKVSWRATHQQQVRAVMQKVGSPLAIAASAADIDRKIKRLVPAPDGLGRVEQFTVRDYSEGLPGLLWRNFFGPPFVHMFGERLISLRSESKQELGNGIVLVQPYELPSQAGTPEAAEREHQLIAHLGPECFYDHEHQLKPTRVPDPASLPPT